MKKSLYYVIASMFLIPLSGLIPIRGTDIWYVQYLGFTTVLFFGISLYLWKWNKYISIFTILVLISTLITAKQHPRAMFMMINIDIGCILLKYISENYKNRDILFKGLLWFIGVQCGWLLMQYCNLDPFFDNVVKTLPDPLTALSGSRNQMGLFMAVVIPLVIAKCIYLLPLVIFALLCSKTSSAVLGAIIGTIFYLYITKHKVRHLSLVLVAIILILFLCKFEKFSSVELNNRYLLYKTTISQVENERLEISKEKDGTKTTKIITCNKWFGYALGNFMRMSPFTQNYLWGGHIYRHTHNDYIEIWFEMGRLGLISILMILSNILYLFVRKTQEHDIKMLFSCLLIYCITANGIFTMHTAVSLMLFVLIFGLLIGGLNGKKS